MGATAGGSYQVGVVLKVDEQIENTIYGVMKK